MGRIPSQEENPNGLHMRYKIRKFTGYNNSYWPPKPTFKDVDKGSEYFVLRLDDGGSDPKHIAACRKAVLTYAEEIKDHLPKLSQDLIERYGG